MVLKSEIEKLNHCINDTGYNGEKSFVNSLFSENEDDPDLRNHLQEEWNRHMDESDTYPVELIPLLDRIHHVIGLQENQKSRSAFLLAFRWYSKIAAVLLIPILILAAYLSLNYTSVRSVPGSESTLTTLYAPLGSRIEFALPDGTKGWLNSGSSLSYAVPFKENRKLNLTGEAYFDVAHSLKYPMVISSGDAKVKVMGTKFNLSAYPAEKYIEVVLEEGKVEFSHPGIATNVVVKPSERIVYESGNLSRSTTDPSKFTAWREGKLVFRGDPMAEVARRIERWYNVEVKLVDEEIDKYVFRGTFEDDSLGEVLRVLSMTSPLKYTVTDRKLLDDGTYRKGQVLLYYKTSEK